MSSNNYSTPDHGGNEYVDTFFTVPRYVLNTPGITLGYLKVYETIFQFWNKGRTCYLSNPSIKKRTGIKSDETISLAFQFLESSNLLERRVEGHRRYLLQPTNKISMCDVGVSVDREGGLGRPRGGVSVDRDINKEYINKELKENKTTTNNHTAKNGEVDQSSSFSFVFSEKQDKELLKLKVSSDKRTDYLFLDNIKHHINHNSDSKYSEYQRMQAVKKLLRKLYNLNAPFCSVNYVDVEAEKERKEIEEIKRRNEQLEREARERARIESYCKDNLKDCGGATSPKDALRRSGIKLPGLKI